MFIKRLNTVFVSHGLDIKKIFNSIRGLLIYFRNLSAFKKKLAETGSPFRIKSLYPCLDDRFDSAGSLPLHYFHLDLHVASRIYINQPSLHVDIGSRIDGFIAHIAVFRQVEIFDIRELSYSIPNVTFRQADLMSGDFQYSDYCDSVSCLHVIEHLGLGRYGDPLDPDGHIKSVNNIHKMLKRGGLFYFATPVGPLRIEYDAHRVFSIRYLLDMFEGKFTVENFAYITDDNRLTTNVTLEPSGIESNYGCNYGCGIFELKKV
ncbi:MAG: DUF268 domain-containing protein [Ignavibacteriaceae bacterium]|nr:DUF268 domain-containing protein [Ignavibacteriaceae bacterium]